MVGVGEGRPIAVTARGGHPVEVRKRGDGPVAAKMGAGHSIASGAP